MRIGLEKGLGLVSMAENEIGNPASLDQASLNESGEREFLAFLISGEEYAVDITLIKEVMRPKTITYIPRGPACIKGIISLRGTIVPIFDLASRLGLKRPICGKLNRIVTVSLGPGMVGFLVESVSEVIRLSEGMIEPSPPTLVGAQAECVKGVGLFKNRFVIIMDVEKTFRPLNLSSETLPVGDDLK